MMKNKPSRKSWREKLEKEMSEKLVEVPEKWARQIGHGKMLVPTPLLVDNVIRKIPRGKLATVNTIRDYLADNYRADMTCPLTTGIFLNIAAHAAEEDKLKGISRITPYWRVLKEGGRLNSKFPGGVKQQATYLKQEGLDIIAGQNHEKLFVKDFEKKLAILN
jgi:alkylated DNA nucleotide flippase Atl1